MAKANELRIAKVSKQASTQQKKKAIGRSRCATEMATYDSDEKLQLLGAPAARSSPQKDSTRPMPHKEERLCQRMLKIKKEQI